MQKTLSVIDLSAIRHNTKLIRSKIGDRALFAVVKADAYGHGAEVVALEIEDLVEGFCVAIVEEGVALCVAGVQKQILVFAPPLSKTDSAVMEHYDLTATVCDYKSARLAKGLKCHIAVNTGMNRYGCVIGELEGLLQTLSNGQVCGVYSHLYAPQNLKVSQKQLKIFNNAERLVKRYFPDALAHISASGGVLLGKHFLKDGVRCGIMLYGYSPTGVKVNGLKPALKVYARLAQSVRVVGGGVGYNFADCKYNALYTYRLGYADGFARRVPLGEKSLCMDAFISTQKQDFMPVMTNAEEYAKRNDTICYEVLCSVTKRSLKIYESRNEV